MKAKLARQLRRAATLFDVGALDDTEYGILAIGIIGQALSDTFEPLTPGDELPTDLGIALWVALAEEGNSLADFGPFAHAYESADDYLAHGQWTRVAERRYQELLPSLRPHNATWRRFEAWIRRERKAVPLAFELLVAALSAAMGFLLGRWSLS